MTPHLAPYSRRVAGWIRAQEAAFARAGAGRAARQALQSWAAGDTDSGKVRDWTAHQIAAAGGCHVRTLYRELPRLVDAGLVRLVYPGSRSARRAAVYCLEDFPTWSSRVTGCPSPLGPLDLKEKSIKAPSSPPVPQAAARRRGERGKAKPDEGAAGAPRKHQEAGKRAPEPPEEASLRETLEKAGCDRAGILSVVRLAREDGRVRQALRDVRAALAYIRTSPAWIRPDGERGLLVRVAQDPIRGAKIRRQLAHTKRARRRGAPTQEERVTGPDLRGLNPCERTATSRRWSAGAIEDARHIFAGMAGAARARVQGALDAAAGEFESLDQATLAWWSDRVLVRAVADEDAAFLRRVRG